MAKTLEQLRDLIQTSIHGRRLGLDNSGFMVGVKGLRKQVLAATSDTTGTTIPNNGFHTVVTTTDDGWPLEDPVAGCEVEIGTASTSTGTHTITPAAATIISTNGVAGSAIAMQGVGAFIRMVGISTAQWLVTSRGGSTTDGATVVVSS